MPPTPIELVCFDLGGVLLRIADSWDDAIQRVGLLDAIPNNRFHHQASFHDTHHRFERGEIDSTDYTRRVAALAGLSPSHVLAILDAWLVEPYPGIDPLLDQLDLASVQTACLSNTNTIHWHAIMSPGATFLPLHRLGHRFASPFVGCRKPDATIYQHVQDQTAVEPESILFFDDTPDNVHAATARGWLGHRIDPSDDPVAQVTEHLRHHNVL